ncbi:MAG: RING finger family 4 domain-containing protein [Parabacteroides sp.]
MDTMSLMKVALRYQAIFLDLHWEDIDKESKPTAAVLAFVRRLNQNGFTVSEELLHALNSVSTDTLVEISECINELMGVNLNWAPLVKLWTIPTGETRCDHLITWFMNMYSDRVDFRGTTLPCGHLIPEGTFPIERYNGCPFCGRQFDTADFVYKGQGSKLKELRLFNMGTLFDVFTSLLESTTPLDETQKDSLQLLLREFHLAVGFEIPMKETAILVIKSLVERDRGDEASGFLKTPTDVLRYLWYEKTGYMQLIEPKTLIAHARKLYTHMWGPLDGSANAAKRMKDKLKLKYDRKTCRLVAEWLDDLPMTAEQAAENMHGKRAMWVRFIRALRLGEYARKPGFERLAEMLDVFYKQGYTTWQGQVDKARLEKDADKMLELLKARPGAFARCLFAAMLRFGSEKVLIAFSEVADQLPARLLLSLGNAAEGYFDPESPRLARPITGVTQVIKPNRLLCLYDSTELEAMVKAVNELYRASMGRRFAKQKTEAKTIFIDPALYNIPISVGDRSKTLQDVSCAVMGMRFPVEGDAVRLFLQWGKGLEAQHLDMDLSCRVALGGKRVADCNYSNLTCVGAKHSGDIREIPDQVGTAEYIELSLPELVEAGAKYVTFTCNAYSLGALSPNLVVGWMNSAYPMEVSKRTGVAYDPSCVRHMVRISECNLSKGLVFGVLDVEKREIIWLEMPFTSQTIKGLDATAVEALLHKLEQKLTIGQLLDMKVQAQGLTVVEQHESADEAYTSEWALNAAAVTQLLTVGD